MRVIASLTSFLPLCLRLMTLRYSERTRPRSLPGPALALHSGDLAHEAVDIFGRVPHKIDVGGVADLGIGACRVGLQIHRAGLVRGRLPVLPGTLGELGE